VPVVVRYARPDSEAAGVTAVERRREHHVAVLSNPSQVRRGIQSVLRHLLPTKTLLSPSGR
jgi:hypothetical protein